MDFQAEKIKTTIWFEAKRNYVITIKRGHEYKLLRIFRLVVIMIILATNTKIVETEIAIYQQNVSSSNNMKIFGFFVDVVKASSRGSFCYKF